MGSGHDDLTEAAQDCRGRGRAPESGSWANKDKRVYFMEKNQENKDGGAYGKKDGVDAQIFEIYTPKRRGNSPKGTGRSV